MSLAGAIVDTCRDSTLRKFNFNFIDFKNLSTLPG
jgi:hypothetical protein